MVSGLTGFKTTLATLAFWPVTPKPKFSHFLMPVSQIDVFAVHDMLQFILFWELDMIPVYLLLSIRDGNKSGCTR